MNYFVKRGEQEFGPYTLADLQKYVASGNIKPSEMARSEGLDQWVTVEQIIGNIPASPPPTSYGSVPSYAVPGGPQAAASAYPTPPGLHWGLVLLFTFLTCGLFSFVWLFIEAGFVQKLRTSSKPMMFYAIGIPLVFVASFARGAANGIQANAADGLFSLIELAGAVVMVVAHFSMKNALEEHYNGPENINLQLSGVMVFFFSFLYFQYHFMRIRTWKTTGLLEPQ